MAGDVWSRPRIPTGESVAAALRLAKELKPRECLLCDGGDETTELLVDKARELRRYVAYESGATEQVEARELPGFKLGRRRERLDAYVAAGVASARIPYDFGGWEPRTVAQLAAVEELCKEGDDSIRVRSVADGGVEVETFRRRERRRHVLDAYGAVVERELTSVSSGVYWTPRIAALAFVIPFAAVAVFDGMRFFLIGLAVCVVILVLASRVDERKHLARPGEKWFVFRLEAPSGD